MYIMQSCYDDDPSGKKSHNPGMTIVVCQEQAPSISVLIKKK